MEKMAKKGMLTFNRKVLQVILLIIFSRFTLLDAIQFSGTTAKIDSLQRFQGSGWNFIKSWKSQAEVNKPGIFIAGFSLSTDGSVFMIDAPGVYYISYSLHIKSTTQSSIKGGLVIDQDLVAGFALQSFGNANGLSVGLAAAGFVRLTSFNNISIAMKAIDGKNNATELLPGSSFSAALITTAGMVPAFSASLARDTTFKNNTTSLVAGWSEGKTGEFHFSTGFVNNKDYVQVICDGIYLFSANVLIRGPPNSEAVLIFNLNLAVLQEVKLNFKNQTTLSVNIHRIMSAYKADIFKMSVRSVGSDVVVLKESSFSASLINKISQHTTGFASFLRHNFTVSGTNLDVPITGWPTDFNGVTEFKSPNLFAQLVNNKQDFNPPQRGIYFITTNLILQCQALTCKDVTVSIYSPIAKFTVASKVISEVSGSNKSTLVSVTTAADILSTNSFAIAVKSQSGKVFVMPGSSFAVCQLPLYYPGTLARLTKSTSFSVTGTWQTITGWRTNQIKGGYDLFGNMNETSGKYEIPLDGMYLVSANIIIVDMEQAEGFITYGKVLDLTKGFFTKTGNPKAVTTLNFGGLMSLKRGDQVYVTMKSTSDSDWSIKENSGFSVAYIGQSSHAMLAIANDQSHTTGWYNLSRWQATINKGGSFQASAGQFVIPVSGVYHVMVNVILQNADQVESTSKYAIALRINDIPVSGLSANRSAPSSTPSRRRFYPIYFSGTFNAAKGSVVCLAAYSAVDPSYTVLSSSSWSMFLVAEEGNSDLVGFAGSKKGPQNMFSTEAGSWFNIHDWQPSTSTLGSFYTPSRINFDDSNRAIIKTTGLYVISANIEIQYSSGAPPVFKIALFIQNELQQNGLTYENIRGWSSFTMHFGGAAFLVEGDTVSLKITCTSKFDGLVISKESGFSITRLPVAELFPAASLTATTKLNIPSTTSYPIDSWTAENSEASFSFTSGKRYNKTTGVFRVNSAGYYLISMNLVLQSLSHDQRNVSLTMMHGSGNDTFDLAMTNRTVSSLSSTILKFQEVGSTIFIATNISQPFGNSASFNNSTSFPPSNIILQEGSSFSVIHFPLKATATTSEAFYAQSYSYSRVTTTELSDWTVALQVDKSAAIFRAGSDGIHFLSMNLKLVEFVGCVTFYFKSNRGNMATSTVTCKNRCQEYITLNNFVRLRSGDRISVFMHLEPNSYLTIAKNSRRTITYVRPYEEETGLSVRIVNSTLVPATMGLWVPLYKYSLGNDTHGVFDARGNYSSFEGMIIPSTGAYQVIINLVVLFANNTSGTGTAEIVVSKDGDISTTGGLYMKKKFQSGQNFTIHVMSSVILPKWTKLKLFIRTDADAYIQEGSTVALVFLDSIIREICKDEGPVMGDSLRPASVTSAIVGENREWRCQAFGNKPATYLWYKNNQVISKKEYLRIHGYLNDTGTYHCVASIEGIMAESNQVQVQIYDVDECFYKNDTCHVNATCANTPGSFACTCKPGFIGNGLNCTDIDECSLGTYNCANHSRCINTPGAFKCRCPDGFQGDGVKYCHDIDECLSNMHSCDTHASCINLVGKYNCTCNKGWFGSGFVCSDSNECTLGTHNCDKNANCTNANGTARCTCKEGYYGNGVAGNCSDINECLLLPHATPVTLTNSSRRFPLHCHAFADCVNLKGSYTCRCKAGFTGNGTHCTDVNECELGSQSIKCAQSADCINLPGSYQCMCRTGYTGDGIQCGDLDECAIKTFVCDPLANCSNTYGAYQCSCPKGYIGDGKTCADNAEIGKSTDPCAKDASSLTCICKNSKTRDQNILCNGLFVAIIILSVVAIIVILFVIKYIKSRRNIKIGPVKQARGKYIEMEDESEV